MRRCEAPNGHPNEQARRGAFGEALPVTHSSTDDPDAAGQRDQRIGGQVIGECPSRDRRGERDRSFVRTTKWNRAPLLGRGELHNELKAVEVRAVSVREHGQLELVSPRQRGRERGVLVQAFKVGVASPQGVVQEPLLQREPPLYPPGRGHIRRR